MKLKNTTEVITGKCPVCDSSWQGMSFRYIYREFDTRHCCDTGEQPVSDEELDRIIALHHRGATHQGRVLRSEDGKWLVCPDCGSRFEIDKD